MYKHFLKRPIDFVVAILSLLLLSPFLLIISLLIKITSKGPLFFMQKRLGRNKKTFKVYKFRTMTDKVRKVDREILKGDAEVTKIGSYLRRFKMDELPQLINVLKGEMSLIGPRPCIPFQIRDFNEDGMYRIKVKPGLTGLAQINGNIFLTWEERWKYDRKYVENVSLALDAKILFKTILIVVFGEDKFVKRPNKNV